MGLHLYSSRLSLCLWSHGGHHRIATCSLSGSEVCCQNTPDSRAREAPLVRNFPAHASVCSSRPLHCSSSKRVEASTTQVPRCTGSKRPKGQTLARHAIPVWGPASGELVSNSEGPKALVVPAPATGILADFSEGRNHCRRAPTGGMQGWQVELSLGCPGADTDRPTLAWTAGGQWLPV